MDNKVIKLKELAKNKKVLILEDDVEIIDSLERLISRFFLKIYRSVSIQEACDIIKENNINNLLIITDINLGDENGLDFVCQVKKKNQYQRIMAISGTEDRNIFIKSIRCGIDRFVLKPIIYEELFEALVDLCQKIDYDNALEENKKLLQESKEYTLKLLQEQDQFLKNAIHEIHTPLAVIITNIDLLKMQNIENESIDAIEAGSRIIQNSYEDMTYVMKKNHKQDRKTAVNLISFIEERKNYFQCIARVNELELTMIIGQSHIPSLSISENKLTRVIDNTLSNAIKYSFKPSKVTITVGVHNQNLFFEVHNIGAVIKNKTKIFERFYRESSHNGGYGLGLNIVAEICKEENIEIKTHSSKERGTTFRYIFKNNIQGADV